MLVRPDLLRSPCRCSSAPEAPGHDARRVDADERCGRRDRFGCTPHLDTAGPRWVDAGEVVDHDGSAAAALEVAQLLGRGEVEAADVDGAEVGVEGEPDRRDVRGAVGADGGDAGEAPE